LAHIYAASGLLGNKDYENRYGDALMSENRRWLRSLRQHFVFKPPIAASPLFIFLFQMPGYFEAEDEKGLSRVFELVQGFVARRGFDAKELKHETIEALGLWIPDEIASYSFRTMSKGSKDQLIEAIEGLKDVALSEYGGYYSERWGVLDEELLIHGKGLEADINGLDILGVWSEVTGITFPYRRFRVRLCEALGGCTSLLAEKVALPSSSPPERAVDTIIHEAGIHFIAPKHYMERGVSPEYFIKNQETFSRYEEAAVCHLKERVYRDLGLLLRSDYHIPLMKLNEEMRKIEQVWKSKKPDTVIDGVLAACLSG
jgi:hypothetical protein